MKTCVPYFFPRVDVSSQLIAFRRRGGKHHHLSPPRRVGRRSMGAGISWIAKIRPKQRQKSKARNVVVVNVWPNERG